MPDESFWVPFFDYLKYALQQAESGHGKLDQLVTAAEEQKERLEQVMATLSNFNDLVAALNAATNVLAAKIQTLIDKVAAGGMTDAEEAQVLADLGAVKDRLTALGADPSNPIP